MTSGGTGRPGNWARFPERRGILTIAFGLDLWSTKPVDTEVSFPGEVKQAAREAGHTASSSVGVAVKNARDYSSFPQ